MSKLFSILAVALLLSQAPAAKSGEYVKTHRAYTHSTEKIVAAACDAGDRVVSVSCYGENVLMEPGEPEHVIALEVRENGCRLKVHVPEQMVRIETQTRCSDR